ncbi:MAG: class I SAM-dependent methyltransferase [Chloroflexota bacterium]
MSRVPARGLVRRVWRRVEASPGGPLAWRLRLLARSSRGGIGRRIGSLALRIGGPDAMSSLGGGAGRSSWGNLPRTYQTVPRPGPISATWVTPPTVEEAGAIVSSVYRTGERPREMNLELLEELNEEYRSKPLVPDPPKYDQPTREDRARRRLLDVHHSVDLAGKRVLELGCGAGFEVWYLSHQFGADAWGVDVAERAAWAPLSDDRTHFVCADIAIDSPFEADFFDRVISFSVFEHVVHPYSVIAELFRIMKPGGLAWISANLHRGPRASHLYRELYFPYPHLLFSDDVIREYREKHHNRSGGASWVNRLSWSQYEDYFREMGFIIHSLRFSEAQLDEAIYERFDNILGRYPKWDLTKDFFYVVLEKPKTAAATGRS